MKLLIAMLISEVFADGCLQGKLSYYKRKENYIYQNDPKYVWVLALFLHALIVSVFMIIPAVLFGDASFPSVHLGMIIISNTVMHAVIDNAKANLHKIGNIEDRLLHCLQVLTTWYILSF